MHRKLTIHRSWFAMTYTTRYQWWCHRSHHSSGDDSKKTFCKTNCAASNIEKFKAVLTSVFFTNLPRPFGQLKLWSTISQQPMRFCRKINHRRIYEIKVVANKWNAIALGLFEIGLGLFFKCAKLLNVAWDDECTGAGFLAQQELFGWRALFGGRVMAIWCCNAFELFIYKYIFKLYQ